MIKILMHKNEQVAKFEISPGGVFKSLIELYRRELLPDWTKEEKYAVQRWYLTRKRSSLVTEFAQARNFYGPSCFSSENLSSYLDCYWVKDEGSAESWEDVNPRETCDPKSDSLFNMLYRPALFNESERHLSSPNVTIPGREPEVWYERNGEVVLLNANSQNDMTFYRRASANEHPESVAKREYFITAERVFSCRSLELLPNEEAIPMEVYYNSMANDGLSKAQNIKAACEAYAIPGWKSFFKSVVATCRGTERALSLSQIKVVRNSDTLKPLRLACV